MVWLNVANLVEELILFAVDNNVDDLVTVFTESLFYYPKCSLPIKTIINP